MLTDYLGLSLLAATPFSTTSRPTWVEHPSRRAIPNLPPTLTLRYYPMSSGSAFQPYIGGGLNYRLRNRSARSWKALGAGNGKLELDRGWPSMPVLTTS